MFKNQTFFIAKKKKLENLDKKKNPKPTRILTYRENCVILLFW